MKKSFCVIIIFVMIISSSAFSLADSDISNRLSDLKKELMLRAKEKNSLSLMII